MAIVVETDLGWLIDHQKALDDIYSSPGPGPDPSPDALHLSESHQETDSEGDVLVYDDMTHLEYKCLPQLFEITQPFRMDSEFQKLIVRNHSGLSEQNVKNKKKRKRKFPPNTGEQAAMDYHSQVRDILMKAHGPLRRLARECQYFKPEPSLENADNNTAARIAARLTGPGDDLINMCDPSCHGNSNGCGIANSWHENNTDSLKMLRCHGNHYLVPPRSRFYMSDISNIGGLVQADVRYNLIVLDPPWQNKSVKRLKSYNTLEDESLLNIPIKALAAQCCLLAVWVTNKQHQQRFVSETLFHSWGVASHVRWLWLKVTRSGECVYDIDSPHKKPYEALMLARLCDTGESKRCCPLLPDNKTIISVPCSVHSRKPPLEDILKPYLVNGDNSLELFARNLYPSWTSWGNEVLKYQHVNFFEKVQNTKSS